MTAAVQSASRKGQITGWHVLVAVVLFFGAVIGVDTFFMVKAYRTFSGEVASNPYEAGLAFNRTLDQRRRETALGWKTGVAAQDDKIVVTIEDREGMPLDHLSVTGVLERPATEAGRQILNFRPIGQGRYEAAARLDGAWDLRGTARNSGDMIEIETRLVAS